jgi:azurin
MHEKMYRETLPIAERQINVHQAGGLIPSTLVNRRNILANLLMAPLGIAIPCVRADSSNVPDVELSIMTDGDLLAFKPTELTCVTGARVHLTFFHTGKYITQEHDWVLTVPGAEAAVAKAGVEAGEAAGYLLPGDPRVVAATQLCGKGEHASVSFVAPPPGDYPFFCSYPGHDAFMRGVLHVTRK